MNVSDQWGPGKKEGTILVAAGSWGAPTNCKNNAAHKSKATGKDWDTIRDHIER